MKKYYVEVQNFNTNYSDNAIIYDSLDESIKEYENKLYNLINYNYSKNKEKTVCIGEAIFENKEDYEKVINFQKNELSCCDVEEYYRMEFDERIKMFNSLKNIKGKGIYI